jgi:transposase InsO family protein
VNQKYSRLFSNKAPKKPGRKPPAPETVQLVIEIKRKNPRMGYGRIAMQVFHATGVVISRYAVARILRKHKDQVDPDDDSGPSWLTFIGHMKDSLWSVDLFRCESITLNTYWVMLVLDQFTRRIIGFAVHAGDCDGPTYCRLFNSIRSGHNLPKYLSSDNDPLFLYPQWRANLRILDIEEIKAVPGVPQSHPFIERLIGTVRREFLDHVLFFNAKDLTAKLKDYQNYYNCHRRHSSLENDTPAAYGNEPITDISHLQRNEMKWRSHCRGLFRLPSAA